MPADKKIECFVCGMNEEFLYYGTISGQIVMVQILGFRVIQEIQAHAGTIVAIAIHPSLPYIACLGMDRKVSIWSISQNYPKFLSAISIRNIRATNEEINYLDVKSNSQALSFHPMEKRLATRTASGALLELNFENDKLELLHCTRLYKDFDIITVNYTQTSPYFLLSGSGNGEISLSEESKLIRRWKIEDESIHWFEHFNNTEYLVASDSRLLARLDISMDQVLQLGPKFASDDFEHVVVNRATGQTLASSFDRNVYELDPVSCEPIRIAFRAPFKCRWLHILSRLKDQAIVQVRDGSLIVFDIKTGKEISKIKTTSSALWTAIRLNKGEIALYGEGNGIVRLDRLPVEASTTLPKFNIKKCIENNLPEVGYVKRADYDAASGVLVLGHISGLLLIVKGDSVIETYLEAPIRDLKIYRSEVIYVATEDGRVVRVGVLDGRVLSSFSSPEDYPIWALAVDDDEQNVIAFERHGKILVLNGVTLECRYQIPDGGRCKRAKWVGSGEVLFTRAGELHLLDVGKESTSLIVPYAGNTVEDFIWDKGRNYIICIGYTNTIGLYDFSSGEKLDEIYDQIDYTKGLIWAKADCDRSVYPFDFFTYGRSGSLHLYRIHNESIVSLGLVTP